MHEQAIDFFLKPSAHARWIAPVATAGVLSTIVLLPLELWQQVALLGALAGAAHLSARSIRRGGEVDSLRYQGGHWWVIQAGNEARFEYCELVYCTTWLSVIALANHRGPRLQYLLFSDMFAPGDYRRCLALLKLQGPRKALGK